MLLTPQDLELFFKLHRTLMFFVNQHLKVVPNDVPSAEHFAALSPPVRIKVRDALLTNTHLIESFVQQNPAHLPDEELGIVHSWRYLVAGKFYLFRELTKYTVFLSTDTEPIAYGVLALSQEFEELVGPDLPVLAQTVLLPFKDAIVYDGLLNAFRISFGPGIRRSLNESFKGAKARHGIVTLLPMSAAPPRVPSKPKAKSRPKATEGPADVLTVIVHMIDQFCRDHLNDEYSVLCRKLAEKLARKRPSPLLRGSPESWASGIVRTIGWVNFLHDKSQTPYMRLGDIDACFGISESGGAAKLKAIRTMLRIRHFDHEWTLPSRMADSAPIWMLEVNGFIVDVRDAPREVQELAFRKGLIPYIPADRQHGM